MSYETTHDVDVAAEFADHGTWQWDNAGGSAWQLDSGNPAHIFRKNPDDRTEENGSTTKDDYFLEDPHESVRSDPGQDGSDPYIITLTNGGSRLFFIDGNLWVHNYESYSFALRGPSNTPVRVTFAVKGNIYISDNFFYDDSSEDGVAFIAVKDPNEPDSGNIYFGDPRFGTLVTMEAFMYAENNFHDNNLSADGSKRVTVNGTMSAGNHVDIQRTFGNSHSRLEVNFDDRLKTGAIALPGIPTVSQQLKYSIALWRERNRYQ